jgi:hypothetical protein
MIKMIKVMIYIYVIGMPSLHFVNSNILILNRCLLSHPNDWRVSESGRILFTLWHHRGTSEWLTAQQKVFILTEPHGSLPRGCGGASSQGHVFIQFLGGVPEPHSCFILLLIRFYLNMNSSKSVGPVRFNDHRLSLRQANQEYVDWLLSNS